MNPAIHAAIIAASNEEAIKQQVEDRLRAAKALGNSSAIAFEPANEEEQKLLDAALASGNVVRTSSGLHYLNERAVADRNEGQGFMALLIVLVLASLIATGAALAVSDVL